MLRITTSQMDRNPFVATSGFWKDSVNAKGFITSRATKSEHFLPKLFLLCDSSESIPYSVEPSIPFAPLTTLYLGKSPTTHSVGLTCLVGRSTGHDSFPTYPSGHLLWLHPTILTLKTFHLVHDPGRD